MSEVAYSIVPQISKLTRAQLRWVKKEAEAARRMQYLDRAIEIAIPFAPVAGLIGGFITVDWLEKKVRTPGGTTAETKKWWMPGSAVPQPGGVDDTWIGPIAAGALRAGLILAFAAQSAEGLSALMNLNPFD